jgi:ZIP family zinc transporter
MMAVVCFDLMPSALTLAPLAICVLGFCIGVLVALFIQDELAHHKLHSAGGSASLLRTGLIIMVGIALHNFPEGLAIGSGFEASVSLGISLIVVIGLHNIPEGLSMAMPLKLCGYSPARVIFYTALTGVPMGIGALFGVAVGGVSAEAIGLSLSLAGGAMLYIVCGDIIPQSRELYRGRLSSLGNVLGFLCGMIVTLTI